MQQILIVLFLSLFLFKCCLTFHLISVHVNSQNEDLNFFLSFFFLKRVYFADFKVVRYSLDGCFSNLLKA